MANLVAGFTGKKEKRNCVLCGTEVSHKEIRIGTDVGTSAWLAMRHKAPCGLDCKDGAAGLSLKGTRPLTSDLHDANCPKCK
jgi:hypothetical protein